MNVQYFASVRELVGTGREIVDLPEGSTVKNLIDSLVKNHGDSLDRYLFEPRTHKLRTTLQLLIGDKTISEVNGLDTVLTDGCVFAIIPPVGGG